MYLQRLQQKEKQWKGKISELKNLRKPFPAMGLTAKGSENWTVIEQAIEA